MTVDAPSDTRQRQNTTPAEPAGPPRKHIALGELAQLYAQLKLQQYNRDPHAPLEPPERAIFEEQLSLFEKNIIAALRGAPSERPSLFTRIVSWALRRKQHDPMIKEYFFCSSLPAGVVLLCEPSSRLYLTFPPDARAPTWIAELLVQAEGLYIEIREILRDPNRGICLEMVFAGIVQLIKLMGNENYRQMHACPVPSEAPHTVVGANGSAAPADLKPAAEARPLDAPQDWHMPPWPELHKIYEAQLSQGADLVRRMAQRQAQLDYFWGMVYGALILGLIVAGVQFVPMLVLGGGPDWMANRVAMDQKLVPLLWLSPVIGGIGAVVSVMQRMGSGQFALRDRAGAEALRRVGAFRPLVGAVFAAVVVTLLFTGLAPLQLTPNGEQNRILLYCVVSFFAGFSERWAQDMLGAGEAAVSAGTDAERRAAAT